VPITLSSRSVRRTALAGAAATLSIALAACSASFSAPTSQPYQAAEGTNADSGSIHVRNMLVLADADGKGELHSVIVNDGPDDDTLVKLAQAPAGTADGTDGSWQPGTVTFSEPKQALDLKAGSSTLLPPDTSEEAQNGEDSGDPITVTGAKPGQMVNVTITFGKAAPINAYVPVLTDDHYSPTPASGE
jgi:copper(I)-binding protein